MYWFAGTGAVQKLRTGKLPVLSKTLKKSMVTMGLAFSTTTSSNLLTYGISGNQSMNVQNQSSKGVLEKRCNLGQNI